MSLFWKNFSWVTNMYLKMYKIPIFDKRLKTF